VTVRFLVDTGASTVTFGAAEADRIGLDYRHGEHGYVSTANGIAPSYQVRLDSVRIGDVEVHGVIATVVQAALPVVLLGNTFLSRFQMKQENALLILDKRY
jgi:aspartyl protease family protein